MRRKYIEANIEEDINLKDQFRIKNLPYPISIRDACRKNYVDNKFSDPSSLKTAIMLILMTKISITFVLLK